MKKLFLGFLLIVAIGFVSCADGNKKMLQSGPGSIDAATQERFIGHVFLD